MIKPNLKNDRIVLILIFIIFLFIRLFSNSEYFFIQVGDDARYLALANSFPYHRLYNNQLFISQQPFYPYVIHFMSFFFQDYIAGILISFISSIITFFIIYKLVGILTNNRYVTFGTLILYSLSDFYIKVAVNVLKESFTVMLTLGAVYFYIKFLKFGKNKSLVYCSIFAAILGLTTDYAIFIAPSFVIIFLMFGNKKKINHALIPLISMILFYSFWLLIRVYAYTHYDYYPAAVDGNIVKTSGWGLKQVLSPNFFPEASSIHPYGISLEPFHYIKQILNMLKLAIFPWPRGLSVGNMKILLDVYYIPQIIIYTILLIAAAYGAYNIVRLSVIREAKENGMLLSLLLFGVFMIPAAQLLVIYRYTITSIIFLFITINYGIFFLAKTFKILNYYKSGIMVLIVLLLLYLPFYYFNNSYLLFSKKKVVEATKTAELLSRLPGYVVMAKNGYPPELSYLTKKKILSLPLRLEDMYLINKFNVSYIVFGDFYDDAFYKTEGNMTVNNYIKKFIKNHPFHFKLLQVVEEDYRPAANQTDHIYVYEVI